jgi:hypothetical protein
VAILSPSDVLWAASGTIAQKFRGIFAPVCMHFYEEGSLRSKLLRSPFEVWIFIVILLIHLYVAFAPANSLMNWYTTDDAFYYFKTAQNIGLGNGITFDGIGRTNGFHPLWMMICVPVFLLANLNLMLPLRMVVVLAGLMNSATVILIWRIFQRNGAAFAGVMAALYWAFSVQVHTITVTLGMESTVNALTVTLLIYLASNIDQKKADGALQIKDFISLGIAAIFTFLSRIDNGFVVAAVLLWVLGKHWNSLAVSGETARQTWLRRLNIALCIGMPVGVTLLVYLGFNQLYFGTSMPVSGQVKRWWGTLPNTVYGFPVDNFWVYLTHLITPQVNIGPWSLATEVPHSIARVIETIIKIQANEKGVHRILVLIISLLITVVGGLLVRFNWNRTKNLVNHMYIIPFFIGCMAQITSYKSTTYIETLNWYWVGEMVLIVLAGGIVLDGLIQWLQNKNINLRVLNASGVVAGLLLFLPFLSYIYNFVPYQVDPQYNEAYLGGAHALEAYTEPGSVIGTTGGGIVAYFIQDRKIINLDGLINSNDYFQRMRRGKTTEYFDQIGLDYVYGNIYMITQSDPYARMFSNRVELIGTVEGASLFRYKPSVKQ